MLALTDPGKSVDKKYLDPYRPNQTRPDPIQSAETSAKKVVLCAKIRPDLRDDRV